MDWSRFTLSHASLFSWVVYRYLWIHLQQVFSACLEKMWPKIRLQLEQSPPYLTTPVKQPQLQKRQLNMIALQLSVLLERSRSLQVCPAENCAELLHRLHRSATKHERSRWKNWRNFFYLSNWEPRLKLRVAWRLHLISTPWEIHDSKSLLDSSAKNKYCNVLRNLRKVCEANLSLNESTNHPTSLGLGGDVQQGMPVINLNEMRLSKTDAKLSNVVT